MRSTCAISTLLVCVFLLATSTAHGGFVIYQEDFAASGSDQPISIAGWNLYITTTTGVENYTGTSVGGVSTGSGIGGYAFSAPRINSSYENAGPSLFATGEAPNVGIESLSELTYTERADGSSTDRSSQRFAVKVGSQWYASDVAYLGGTSNVGPGLPFNPVALELADWTDGSNWRELTLSVGPGGAITVAASTVPGNLSGKVTDFGVYATNGNNGDHFRLDDFTVTAIPEPTTLLVWSLLAGLGVGLGWRRRK